MAHAKRLSDAGVAGPLFISVGKSEQLAKFLALNPELNGAAALIDDTPTFEAYRAAGFKYLLGDVVLETQPNFKPPKSMTPGKWWSYLRSAPGLVSVPENIKFGSVPPAVRVLGGTYAIDGDAVLFSHMDKVPGATPDIQEVLASIGA